MAVDSPRRLVPEARRRQLVEVGLELFAEESYNEVRLDDVAERAGVRRSLLYRYFPGGKPDLYLAVVEDAWSRLVGLVDTDPSSTVDRKLPENVATFLDLAETDDPALRVLAQARRVDEPRVMGVAREARREWARRIAQNHLRDANPEEAVITALTGYLAMSEALIEEWRLHATITRVQVEAILQRALPPIVRVASEIAAAP